MKIFNYFRKELNHTKTNVTLNGLRGILLTYNILYYSPKHHRTIVYTEHEQAG